MQVDHSSKFFSEKMNLYRDLLKERTHNFVPVMELTRNKKKDCIVWTDEENADCDAIKE